MQRSSIDPANAQAPPVLSFPDDLTFEKLGQRVLGFGVQFHLSGRLEEAWWDRNRLPHSRK